MLQSRPFLLPWEPEYTGHRKARSRREQAQAWLGRREALDEAEAPSIAPDHLEAEDRIPARRVLART